METKQVLNIFTILVAEDRQEQAPKEKEFLGDRIKMKSLPRMSFGVVRYTRPIGDLLPLLASMVQTGKWSGSGDPLHVGKLLEAPQQFIPPDSTSSVAWNKVLKNNFWNGSHVFEWSDTDKSAMKPFFEDSRRLQELSARVAERVPIFLAAFSDRLGNLAVQLPVTVIMSRFGKKRTDGAFTLDVSWNPTVTSRPLRASCELEFDGTVSGYAETTVQAEQTSLPVQPGFGIYRGHIWDDQHQVLMAATGASGFIDTVALNMNVLTPEPRTFVIKGDENEAKIYTVGLIAASTSIVGDTRADETGGHTRKRMYKDQLDRLTAERTFVQYKPAPDKRDTEHEKALGDLRMLISQYGREGVWLWDPFLTARDVCETLFHCPYSGSDLRALTGAREVPLERSARSLIQCITHFVSKQFSKQTSELTNREEWVENQRLVLDSIESNWLGLRLEYRVKHGPVGFGFHDRFLIFPRAGEDALAWSLGTSVNGIGMEHHILQRVDNGQLIRDAFLELWEQLDKPGHLIWKKP
ncbi:MAG: VPA1262 family N-terminal domain-containing protein [Acidobacteriaceae bacterium]